MFWFARFWGVSLHFSPVESVQFSTWKGTRVNNLISQSTYEIVNSSVDGKGKKMNKILTAALSNALAKTAKSDRDSLPVGRHALDETVTLRVTGSVLVSEDTEYTPTASIPLKAALALFVRYSGVTGQAAMDALTRAMTEALETGTNAAQNMREMAILDAAEATVRAGLTDLPKAPRKGPVTVQVAVSQVGAGSDTVDVAAALNATGEVSRVA